MKTSLSKVKKTIFENSIKMGLIPDNQGYLNSYEKNLLDIPNWNEIELEIGSGQGSELKPDKNGRIKFHALHSSSALCVNNFTWIKHYKSKIEFLGYNDFMEASFEKKLPTGISSPNLDFYLENSETIIGIESKYLESLSLKTPNGNLHKYINRKELSYLPPGFMTVIQYYQEQKTKFSLDAAQLIKHSIGLMNKLRETPKNPVLVYIYWEPENWSDYKLYHQHKNELEGFNQKIEPYLTFKPISYLEFWKIYVNNPLIGKQINEVKLRYSTRI